MAGHDKAIYLRITEDDARRLHTLAKQITVATRSSIARAAIRIGLDEIERDLTVLLGHPPPKRGGALRRKKAKKA